jgi:hypothetical protein
MSGWALAPGPEMRGDLYRDEGRQVPGRVPGDEGPTAVQMRAMTAKAARSSRSKASVSLTLAAVAAQATGTPSPSTATWYFGPCCTDRLVGAGSWVG